MELNFKNYNRYTDTPARFRKKMYICNRKKCENCYEECYHTMDIAYAVDPERGPFSLIGDYWWQQKPKETK